MGIASGSLFALLFRIGSMVLWGVMGVLTARTLSVDDKGVYSSAIVLSSAIGGISSFAAATGYFVSNQKRAPGEVAANALTMAFPLALVVVGAGLAISPLVGGTDGRIVELAALSMGPAILRNTMLGVILGTNRIIHYNVAVYVPILLAFSALLLWVGVLGHRSAESALMAWCVAQYLSLIPFLPWGREWWAWLLHHRPDSRLMVSMVRFSFVASLGGAVGILTYRVDQLLVISLDSKNAAGVYSSAVAVAEGLWLFSSSISLASFARVGRGSRREAAQVTATGVRHTLMVVVIGAIAGAFLGPPLVELLFGHPYRGATEPLRILCIGTAFFAPQGLMYNYFVNQLGRPVLPLAISLLTLSLSLVGGFLLIPPFGIAGAAWATTFSYSVTAVVCVSLFCWLAETPFSELWRIRFDDVASYWDLARDVVSGRVFRRHRAESDVV